MTKAVRQPTASAVVLLLCLLGLSSAAPASAGKNNKATGEADQRKLFKDDENFWTRFVQEISSSSLTKPPTPAPTPEPSAGPTDFCETEVN